MRCRALTRRKIAACVCVGLTAVVALFASQPAESASSASTVVGATVLSATSLDLSSCTGAAINFGQVTPGSSQTTSADCSVLFGSSNDRAQLTVAQSDGAGVAMWQPTSGALDAGFSGDGVSTAAVGPGTNMDEVTDGALQADGRLVIVGTCDMGATANDMCIVRMTAAGALDTTFDGDGRVTYASVSAVQDAANAVAIQPDGRIVVGGTCQGTGSLDTCLLRLLPTGALDPSFGTGGVAKVALSSGANLDAVDDLLVDPEGRIVTAGTCLDASVQLRACIARFLANGTPDTSFAGTGYVITDPSAGTQAIGVGGLVLHPDGRATVSATCTSGGNSRMCAARVTAAGTIDTTFSGDGAAQANFGSGNSDLALSLLLQPDGAVVATGYCAGATTSYDACLARFTSSGAIDTGFGGGDGLATIDLGGNAVEAAWASQLQANGSFLTAGACTVPATGMDACLLRVRADGTLDTSFGTGGARIVSGGGGTGDDFATAIVEGRDGALFTVGICTLPATGGDACAMAFTGGAALGQYASGSSDWTTPGTSAFGMCLRTLTGATTSLVVNPTCPVTNGGYWTAAPAVASIAATTSATGATATANFRFGLRTASNTAPGLYVAPLTFAVTAP